jgi:putative effector of murein hydrolase
VDKQRATELGWLDKLAIKHGSLLLTALAIAIPLYTRFVQLEHSLKQLQVSVDKLSGTVNALHEELAAEKSTTALLSLRLSILEKETNQPRLFK